MKVNLREKGVTIAELVVYMGILSIVLLLFVQLFALIVNKQLETESVSSVQQDSNYLLLKFNHDFQQMDSITLPSQPGQTSLVLKCATNMLETQYLVENQRLIASTSGTKIQLNGYDTIVSNPLFIRLGNGSSNDVVRITFDITSKAKKQSGSEYYQFNSTFGLREK